MAGYAPLIGMLQANGRRGALATGISIYRIVSVSITCKPSALPDGSSRAEGAYLYGVYVDASPKIWGARVVRIPDRFHSCRPRGHDQENPTAITAHAYREPPPGVGNEIDIYRLVRLIHKDQYPAVREGGPSWSSIISEPEEHQPQ